LEQTRSRRFKDALHIFEKSFATKDPQQQNADLLNTIIGACCECNQHQYAYSILPKLHPKYIQKLDTAVLRSLAFMCFKMNNVKAASKLLSTLHVSTTAIDAADCLHLIRTFTNARQFKEALTVLDYMDHCKIKPDSINYTFLLKACTITKDLPNGRRIHCHILKNHVPWSAYMRNSLLAMYVKCRDLQNVKEVLKGKIMDSIQ
jgi:pentatricopeptide repeat protein